MGYNRRNLLLKIIAVQNITLEQKKKGATQEWIFQNIVSPRFFISRRTFYNWLAINAKKEIKTLCSDSQPAHNIGC